MRGQGAQWSAGDTPDPHAAGGPQHPGFLTRGIEDPIEYYYRRLITDSVRAVDAILEYPAIDGSQIAVSGTSQGGGLALVVAGLSRDVGVLLADVPFLCDIRRAIEITDALPHAELVGYLRIQPNTVESALATVDSSSLHSITTPDRNGSVSGHITATTAAGSSTGWSARISSGLSGLEARWRHLRDVAAQMSVQRIP